VLKPALDLASFGTQNTFSARYSSGSSAAARSFLEDRGEERVKAYKLLKEAYGLRSRAVHPGRLEARSGEVGKKLDEVADVCAIIARKLINAGSFPDWDTVLLC